MRNKTNRCIYPVNSIIDESGYVITSPNEKYMNPLFDECQYVNEKGLYIEMNEMSQKAGSL